MLFRELATQGRHLLDLYNPVSNEWDFPMEGDFWEAVKLAHKKNIFGQGKKIAVVDMGFDLTIPKLRDQSVLKTEPPKNSVFSRLLSKIKPKNNHGTIVALLILKVAPKANLELYDISNKPLRGSVEAFKNIASSDTPIVNYSVGTPSELYGSSDNHGKKDHCEVCGLVEPSIQANKLIVAATGNDNVKKYCPAIRYDVVSVGFRSEERHIDSTDQFEEAILQNPTTYSQSPIFNFSINQIDEFLGSSFASPLLAGAVCLLDDIQIQDIQLYLESIKFASEANGWEYHVQGEIQSKTINEKIGKLYLEALRLLPHNHSSNDNFCLGCSLFASTTYINASKYFLRINQFDLANHYSSIAVNLAPWSPHAASVRANSLKGNAIELFKKNNSSNIDKIMEEAISEFERAIKLRPNHKPYQNYLEEMRKEFTYFKLSLHSQLAFKNQMFKEALSLYLTILTAFSEKWLKEKGVLIIGIYNIINSLRDTIGHNHLQNREYQEAENYLKDIPSDFVFENDSEQRHLNICYDLGKCLLLQNKIEEAVTYYLKVLELNNEGLANMNNIPVIDFHNELASCYLLIGRYELAINHFDLCLKYCFESPSKNQNKHFHGDLLAKKAISLFKLGLEVEAEQIIKEAAPIIRTYGNNQSKEMLNDFLTEMSLET